MKDISSYYKGIKVNYTNDNFLRLTADNFNEIKNSFNKIITPGIDETFEEMKKRLDYYGLDINDVYFSRGHYYNFTYKKGFAYITVDSIYEKEYVDAKFAERLKRTLDRDNEMASEKNFQFLFMVTDSKYHFLLFNEVFDMIPDEEKYVTFIHIYTRSDYGLNAINHESLRKLFKLNKDKSNIQNLKVDKEGYVTIYRGAENLSSPLDKAYSWTWDKKIGEFFGDRFKTGTGVLYRARVNKENIIDYINDRKEKEILVFPEHVEDIQVIKKYKK